MYPLYLRSHPPLPSEQMLSISASALSHPIDITLVKVLHIAVGKCPSDNEGGVDGNDTHG